jgi:hypothetical protein
LANFFKTRNIDAKNVMNLFFREFWFFSLDIMIGRGFKYSKSYVTYFHFFKLCTWPRRLCLGCLRFAGSSLQQ